MGVFVSSESKVLIQGITGKEARFWIEWMLKAGTDISAGVTPGKEGERVSGIPVYDTVKKAINENYIDTSVIFVPAAFAKDAAFEALDAGIKKIVLLSDGVPIMDSIEIRTFSKEVSAMVIGPNTAGVATIGEAMLGFIPFWLSYVYQPGSIGIITRSGSLTNEIASHIVKNNFGITTVIGVGGDTVPCARFVEIMSLFNGDSKTEAVVIVGEPGGTMEEEIAEYIIDKNFNKPVVAYIAGRCVPQGKKMGHAGALITGKKGSVPMKIEALKEAGVQIAEKPAYVGNILKELLLSN